MKVTYIPGKLFICVANCPELDGEKRTHCIQTKVGIKRREEMIGDYCPCGNKAIWKELN
jgi:hypothetical protein